MRPKPLSESGSELASTGFLFQGVSNRSVKPGETAGTDNTQQILAELEKIDQEAENAASTEEIARLTVKRADLLEQVAKQSRLPRRPRQCGFANWPTWSARRFSREPIPKEANA